jgi:hypothetical protein
MEAVDLLCSRNARLRKALVGRAQWEINHPPIPEEILSELGGSIIYRAMLAWVNGASRRAKGWAGENDGRSWTNAGVIP